MIKIENLEVHGIETAARAMRNPFNSWEKSDSVYALDSDPNNSEEQFYIGEKDLSLMHKLYLAGSDHRKFLRFITVSCDITAPLYWWSEFDTYKVGTVASSTSTMHTLAKNDLTCDDFSFESIGHGDDKHAYLAIAILINTINLARKKYIETNDIEYFLEMKQLLPSSFNQRRTILLNYEVLSNIIRPGRRLDHKLPEWREFCKIMQNCLYFKEIVEGVPDSQNSQTLI